MQTTKVPDLDGMTESEAEAALKAANLTGKAAEEENDEVDEGTVFWQSQDAGTEVDEGTEIEYKVAKAAETVNVPGVLGKSFSEASNELSSAGFKVVDGGTDYSSDYAEGKVMSQSVTGSAKKGTEVTLVVSKGAKKETVDVDSLGLEGMTQEQAQRALANAGLRYYVSSNEASSTVPRGSVISYSPTGEQEAGATIALVISTGAGTGTDTDS